jgi:hypothetical protein
MSRSSRFAAVYGVVVGALMLAQWAFFLATGQVPELQSEPWRIALHLAAEFITAIGLIVAGIALLRCTPWSQKAYLVFTGMLLYSVIVSPGYFAQQGQWALVAMFALLLVLAVTAVLSLGSAVGSREPDAARGRHGPAIS